MIDLMFCEAPDFWFYLSLIPEIRREHERDNPTRPYIMTEGEARIPIQRLEDLQGCVTC